MEEEIENNISIHYSYTEQGKVSQAAYPNGDLLKYEYYPDGTKKKVSSRFEEISYAPSGDILEFRTSKNADISYDNAGGYAAYDLTLAADGVYVIYDINSNVGVTNYHTYYNLPQSGFNCYTFAIGKDSDLCNPGYYSGRGLDLNSLSGIKLNVEHDQRSLGRSIYDSTVNASIPYHSWKIALRILAGHDYHFMQISNMSGAAWKQKAGISGPVMQLLNSNNPNNVTWDLYSYNFFTGKYVVNQTGYYNSSIHYLIIRD